MDRLNTHLDTDLGAVLREQLNDNFDKIQYGFSSQSDDVDNKILGMLGDVPLQEQNEVTQARVSTTGRRYKTLKGRLDDTQIVSDTALKEVEKANTELSESHTNYMGETYNSLRERLDKQEQDLIGEMNNKISQINVNPETFSDLDSLKNAYPNGKNGLFIIAANGHKYIWSNNTWTDSGVYQATGVDFNVDGIRQYTPNQKIGGISPFDGNIDSNKSASYYEINVNNINRIGFYNDAFTSNYGYAFYNKNNEFIPGSGLIGNALEYKIIDVPADAQTFRVTNHLDTRQVVTLSAKNSLNEVSNTLSKKVLNDVFGNKKMLELNAYQYIPLLISSTTGLFTKVRNSSAILIPVSEIGKAVRIKSGKDYESVYTFLSTNSVVEGNTPSYCGGYNGVVSIPIDETDTIVVPEDANYLYIANTLDDGGINDVRPEFVNPMMDTLVTVAAANSSELDKSRADYICTGINDEKVINDAIKTLVYGGTVKLFDGEYFVDSFDETTHTAIYFENNGHARTINFVGSTENKSFLSDYGVSLHVTQTAFNSMQSGANDYNVFAGSNQTIPIGQWQGLSVNANFENFYLYFYTSKKQLVGINGQYFGSMYAKQVGIYSESYFSDRFDRHKPTTPVMNSIGIISVNDANDEMARIGMDTVNVGGLGTGIIVARAEHLILQNCTVSRSVIGYQFKGNANKPLTLINNADEGNTHLPQFTGSGLITAIDFSIERLDGSVVPDDPTGDTDPFAKEASPNSWRGSFVYNIQGSASGIDHFWQDGSGKNIKTTKVGAPKFGDSNPTNPDFLQEFYRTDLKKKVIYDGTSWYDTTGNIIS